MVVAVVMALVFASPFALMIGVLGPVMALGSWWESKRSHRDQLATQADQRVRQVAEAESAQERADEEFRQSELARYPGVEAWMAQPLWRPRPGWPPSLRVGLDQVERSDGTATTRSRRVPGVPRVVTLGAGLAVVGQGPDAAAVYRHLAIELSASWQAHHPEAELAATWPVAANPPHTLEWPSTPAVAMQWVSSPQQVAHDIRVVVVAGSDTDALLVDGRRIDQALRADRLSAPATLWARRQLDKWKPPQRAATDGPGDPGNRAALWISIDGQHWHDLATDGPHALVWGQSGRGKTVLLQRLLLDAATRYSSEKFSAVLIDFKGGAGALGLQGLPHLAGVLTDLDSGSLQRVFLGLEAELARREQLLADHGVGDLRDLPDSVVCARTIVAIDEVALLLERAPEWSPLLSDVAARGRSLGVHLVVSGQRMTSQVPRSVIVNAGLRWCVGVTDSAEAAEFLPGVSSTTVQSLVTKSRGHAIGLAMGESFYLSRVEPLQPPTPREVAGIAPAARLWAESLPDVVEPRGDHLGLVELAAQQRLRPWRLQDISKGLMVVVGDPGSGLTHAINRVAQCLGAPGTPKGLAVRAPTDPAVLLDCLHTLTRQAARHDQAIASVLIPRLDTVLAEASDTASMAIADALASLAWALAEQDAPGWVILGTRPSVPRLRTLVAQASTVVSLAVSQAEIRDQLGISHSRSGSPRTPGRGLWGECPVQWALPEPGVDALSGLSQWTPPGWAICTQQDQGGIILSDDPAGTEQRNSRAVWRGSLEDQGWRVWGSAQAGMDRATVDRVLTGAGVLFPESTAAVMRSIVGHELAPVVSAPDGYAWWLRVDQVGLVDLRGGLDEQTGSVNRVDAK